MSHLENDLVSVVMPAYNAEHFISRTIESVLSQSYSHWELLVVDDCSRDSTREIVEKFRHNDSRIRLIALEKNHGAPATPRNIGVCEAKGSWVAFLDADDIWHPEKLVLQMNALHNADAIFCSTKMLDFTDDTLLVFAHPGNIRIQNISFAKQLRKFRTPTSSVIASKDLLMEFPFNPDPRYKAREDLDCWLRIHEKIGTSIKLMFPLLYYRIIKGQISGSKWRMIFKTHMVLSEYRLISGEPLGWKRYYYSTTQTLYSIYYRLIKNSL